MPKLPIFFLAFASLAAAQSNVLTEDFSGGSVPAQFTVLAGTASVVGGALNLNSGCIQIARPGGNGTFSRENGLSISADITIQDVGFGDFKIWSLYDSLTNCQDGPVNGYGAGWFPQGSDDPNNYLRNFVSAFRTDLSTAPTTLPGNTRVRVRQDFLPGGVISTFINGVLVNTVVDTTRQSGLLAFNTWQNVIIDNVSITTLQPTVDTPFQVRYMSNLNLSDSVVNITNSGARGAGLAAGTSASTTGALCVNVYAFSPDEQLVSCCSCPVTPNGLVSLSARQDLISNTLTPAVPTSIVVKLFASTPVGGSCTGSAASPGSRAPGLLAFGTTAHAGPVPGDIAITETPFLPASLSAGEFSRLTQLCTFINANGSGFGICRSCRLGGLGAGRL